MTNELTFYVPLFTTMEFVVYIGALRVGQIFTNPLGEDESCFEMVRKKRKQNSDLVLVPILLISVDIHF
jgi:hypothetical protein